MKVLGVATAGLAGLWWDYGVDFDTKASVLTKLGRVKPAPSDFPEISKTNVACGALAATAACGLGYLHRREVVNYFTNLCGCGDYYPQPEDSSPSRDVFHPGTRAIHDTPMTSSGFLQSGVMIIIGLVVVAVIALILYCSYCKSVRGSDGYEQDNCPA